MLVLLALSILSSCTDMGHGERGSHPLKQYCIAEDDGWDYGRRPQDSPGGESKSRYVAGARRKDDDLRAWSPTPPPTSGSITGHLPTLSDTYLTYTLQHHASNSHGNPLFYRNEDLGRLRMTSTMATATDKTKATATPSATTTDDLLPKRIVEIARNLSMTPVELIEPVLADLPLDRVLDLMSTPYAFGSKHEPTTSAPDARESGSALRTALSQSPKWNKVLGTSSLGRVAALWLAFYRISFLAEGKPPKETFFCMPSYILDGFRPYRHKANDKWLEEELESDLKTTFFWCFIRGQRLRGTAGTSSSLRAVCKYLPAPEHFPALSRLEDDEAEWWSQMTADDCITSLPQLLVAHRTLCGIKIAELRRLADLYDLYPTFLRMPYAPYVPPKNLSHIPNNLRSRSRKTLKSAFYCFRYAHSALVPYDWCFQLFHAALEHLPSHLRERDSNQPKAEDEARFQDDLLKAMDGLRAIYTHDEPRPVRLTASLRQITHDTEEHRKKGYPTTFMEFDWLQSFCRSVKWMETEFPRLAADLKASSSATSQKPPLSLDLHLFETITGAKPAGRGVLLEAADFKDFIQNSAATSVAQQLRADLEISKQETATELPSLTALYMPDFSSPRAREIAMFIWPDDSLDISVRQMLFKEMLATIKNQLSKAPKLDDTVAGDGQGETQSYQPQQRTKKCYICRLDLKTPHKTFKAMCSPCGDFNLAERALSLPQKLSLDGKTALVTGGRVNLGLHTALRLLRCGAFVIASSRYPEDTLVRYQKEANYASWADRLRIVGADFRTARDAFSLVETTKAILQKENRKLDILINNAAQTLTDPIEKEQRAIEREQRLLEDSPAKDTAGNHVIVVRQGYTARVRGGVPVGAITGNETGGLLQEGQAQAQSPPESTSPAAPMSKLQVVASESAAKQSSWVQSLSQIPYEDVISAHSVNTFVPLILIRELLPLMAQGGQIVNVSSREGIFEWDRRNFAKYGKHVHTNMSKAGLNMITETEAAAAWEGHKVAMNTVDPGYMSAAPEFELAFGGERPIGWEDGAGRVLWPIAKSQKDGAPIWGRFLKHYGAARVDTRLGRG